MTSAFQPKYTAEFFCEYLSNDRFIYRVSDLEILKGYLPASIIERLDDCHIYLITKRPRLSVKPNSVYISNDRVIFVAEYRINGKLCENQTSIPKSLFSPEESLIEEALYPHRELIARDSDGNVRGRVLLANFVHVMAELPATVQDLEVVYVGKGMAKSAQDRLESHSTLQKILAEINSNEPDVEVFAVVYSFQYSKRVMAFPGVLTITSVKEGKRHNKLGIGYKPSLSEQISLIEASIVSYFRTVKRNTQQINFPHNRPAILKPVIKADLAAIVVQLDNTNIGHQKMFSSFTTSKSIHNIVVDFRKLEKMPSIFTFGNASSQYQGQLDYVAL